MRKLAVPFILLLFVGCESKIDATNEMTLKASVYRIAGSLSEKESEEFIKAVDVVAFDNLFEDDEESLQKALHNKTRKQILRQAAEIQNSQPEKIVDKWSFEMHIEQISRRLNGLEKMDLYEAIHKLADFYGDDEARNMAYGKSAAEIIAMSRDMRKTNTKVSKEKKKKPWER